VTVWEKSRNSLPWLLTAMMPRSGEIGLGAPLYSSVNLAFSSTCGLMLVRPAWWSISTIASAASSIRK
jgi:hypothetical protein